MSIKIPDMDGAIAEGKYYFLTYFPEESIHPLVQNQLEVHEFDFYETEDEANTAYNNVDKDGKLISIDQWSEGTGWKRIRDNYTPSNIVKD